MHEREAEIVLKIAYFLTHPIQYQSPMIRALVNAGTDIQVFYGPMTDERTIDDCELGRREAWDIPLFDGYPYQIIRSIFASGPTGWVCLHPRIKSALERLRPDVVWIHGWGDVFSAAAWNAAWQLGIPVFLRGESHLKGLKDGWLRRWLHKQILRRCFGTVTCFLAIGSANREFYRSYGVPEGKIVDVPYAVDNARFSRVDSSVVSEAQVLRERLGIPPGERVVGFFGKLKKAKRPDLALRGVARVAAGMPSEKKPWLIFVGDGPLRAEMELLARREYPERTRFLGFQNQTHLPACYHLIDLLLLPSDFEPWGLVVNEAMCLGRPAVVSDRVGAGRDLVLGNGQVFTAGSLEDLALVLRPWLDGSGLVKDAGERALKRIQNWSFQEDVVGLRTALGRIPVAAPQPHEDIARPGVVAAYLGVHQVFQMGAAAAEAGRLEHFYCSLIAFPHRWGAILARWLFIPSAAPLGAEAIPPERISETPLPLLFQRIADHCVPSKRVDPLYANTWFGRLVSQKLARHAGAGIMVGAETCSLELFQAAKMRGMRCVMDCHGIPTRFLQDGIERAADELGLKHPRVLDSPAMAERKYLERELADVMVLCSDLQRDVYLKCESVPAEKLRVVPLWVDTEFWRPPVKRERVMADKKGPLRVLYAGAVSLGKGIPYMLTALNQMGGDVELTMVGPVKADMRPLLQKLRFSARCLPYGPRLQLRDLYHSHDVLVVPSLGDSFGFVAVEAMACGLPVIITDRCGAPVPDPSWRVPAFSAEAITSRLEYYARDHECCFKDGLAASIFASQWTSARYRKSIQKIYNELIPYPSVLAA